MTWNEFKEFVDKKLSEQGSDGNIEIDYIDVTHITLDSYNREIDVCIDEDYLSIY